MEAHPDSSSRGTQANFTTFTSLVSGFLLLTTGFFAGWYWQNASVQDQVRVEVVERGAQLPAPLEVKPSPEEGVSGPVNTAELENCEFIGSKNSDKFHSPNSAPAKRILSENRVCFASEAEALEEGYEEGTID